MSIDNVPHVIRTAADPRQSGMYTVFLSDVQQVNEDIRLIRLSIPTSEVIPLFIFRTFIVLSSQSFLLCQPSPATLSELTA